MPKHTQIADDQVLIDGSPLIYSDSEGIFVAGEINNMALQPNVIDEEYEITSDYTLYVIETLSLDAEIKVEGSLVIEI